MRERDIEKYLVARVKDLGGEVRKLKWIGRAHAPDRFIALNGAHLVELKAPGEKLRPGQLREHNKLRLQDVSVHVVDSQAGVDMLLSRILRI